VKQDVARLNRHLHSRVAHFEEIQQHNLSRYSDIPQIIPNQQNHAPCWSSILHNNSCLVKHNQQWSSTVINSIQVQHSTISDISTERHRLGSFGLIGPGGPPPSAPLDPNASSCDAMRCTCGAALHVVHLPVQPHVQTSSSARRDQHGNIIIRRG
jgi:hypothetical protein